MKPQPLILAIAASTLLAGCAEIGLLIGSLGQSDGTPPPGNAALSGTVLERAPSGDDTKPLKGVTITLQGQGINLSATTDEAGRFAFSQVAPGVSATLTAEKLGYTRRERSITTSASPQTVHFGGARGMPDYAFALDDRPAVIQVSGSPTESDRRFSLTFSEAMNASSVESQLVLVSDNAVTLSVGATLTKDTPLVTSESLTFAWNQEKTQVGVTLREALPTDKETAKVPKPKLQFQGAIKDDLGVSSSDAPFQIDATASDRFLFATKPDQTAPTLQTVEPVLGSGSVSDRLVCTFSEGMQLQLPGGESIPKTHAAQLANISLVAGTFETPLKMGNLMVNGNQSDTQTVMLAAEVARLFIQTGDTVRFDWSNASAVVTSVGDYVFTLDGAVTVSDNEPVSLAKIGSARPLTDSLLSSLAGDIQVSFGKTTNGVVIDWGNQTVLQSGSKWTVRFDDKVTDPAGNSIGEREQSGLAHE